jgi:hypothetical protein
MARRGKALQMLRHCRDAMTGHGRLLMIEATPA